MSSLYTQVPHPPLPKYAAGRGAPHTAAAAGVGGGGGGGGGGVVHTEVWGREGYNDLRYHHQHASVPRPYTCPPASRRRRQRRRRIAEQQRGGAPDPDSAPSTT